MPRQARLDSQGALHHIITRGINKSDIFVDDQDRHLFLQRLGTNITDAKCAVYAWALVNNHLHLLFKTGEEGVSSVMRKQLTWYAVYFNRKYDRSGHLFENRYKSILCEEDRYLLALVRYIHLNPIRAGIIKTIDELDNYPWTGHSVIMGKSKQEWMNTDYVLFQFGKQLKGSREAYRKFIEDGCTENHIISYSGGGLLPSYGGWSEIKSMRHRGELLDHDDRILGSSDFVERTLDDADEKQKWQLKMEHSKSISDIITEQSAVSGISQTLLRSGSRKRDVSRIRCIIAQQSVDELGMSFAEIAKWLNINTSAVRKAYLRHITT